MIPAHRSRGRLRNSGSLPSFFCSRPLKAISKIEQLFAEKYADEHQGGHLDKFPDVYIPEASRYDQYTGQGSQNHENRLGGIDSVHQNDKRHRQNCPGKSGDALNNIGQKYGD